MKTSEPRIPKKKRKKVCAKRSERSFTSALHQAEKRLAKAIDERALCQNKLALLNVEIPKLEQIIRVLSNQLQPGTVVRMPVSTLETFNGASPGVPHPPPATLYKEPDLTGVASVPAVIGTPGEPEEGTDEEGLPRMGGGWN